jgi:ribosomal protein S6
VKHYEGMFLCHNKEARKDTDHLAEHVRTLIEKCGGQIHQITRWDERELAYPVKGVGRGVYYLVWYLGDSTTDTKLRHEVRLSSMILRHLTLGLEAFPERQLETFTEMQSRLAGVERREDEDGAPGPVAVVDGEE